MPLLPLEPYLSSEELLNSPAPEVDGEERWWVLHTRPRAEKALARQCLQHDLPFYLPLYHKRWRSKGRMQSSYLPLFPGYLFLYGDGDTRLGALETNLVAQVLAVTDQQQIHEDLARVNRLIATDSELTPEGRWEPGSPVVVTQGPLAGMEGKVIRRGKNRVFLIEVRFLHQGVSVELESWMIEPLVL
jgi:transcription antitermination factor NusG